MQISMFLIFMFPDHLTVPHIVANCKAFNPKKPRQVFKDQCTKASVG